MSTFQIKHGPMPNNTTLEVGEFGFDTSKKQLYIGTGNGMDLVRTSTNLIVSTVAPPTTAVTYPDGTIYIYIQGENT